MCNYKFYYSIICISFFSFAVAAQYNVKGTFSELGNQQIILEGFAGLQTYRIAETTADSVGNFSLPYRSSDYGVGYLKSVDNKPLFVILSGETVEIKGALPSDLLSIVVTAGAENRIFEQYATEHPKREQALSAWLFLEQLYATDSLFRGHNIPKGAILTEKNRIKREDSLFLAGIDSKMYVSWFLPTRKLISNVSVIAQYRPKEIAATLHAFRNLDYTDPRLYKSGLFKDAIEAHYWLLENMGQSLDSVFVAMNQSTDYLIQNLASNPDRFNEVTKYLFDLLERHSLFRASEYLALKVLNQNSCTVNTDLAHQLEYYRAMKKGNTAADIVFKGQVLNPKALGQQPKKLSDIRSDYVLLVFGAGWCPNCVQELGELSEQYALYKAQGLEVVFVSLDTDQRSFMQFAGNFPFMSFCDFKKWESKPAKDYHVFATPTMYLLNQKREILLRPTGIKQVSAWVDWVLVKGNKIN